MGYNGTSSTWKFGFTNLRKVLSTVVTQFTVNVGNRQVHVSDGCVMGSPFWPCVSSSSRNYRMPANLNSKLDSLA